MPPPPTSKSTTTTTTKTIKTTSNPPQDPSQTAVPISPKSLTTIITNDRNILHLLVYKSKNQHRSSLWFKWLRMLKSCLERITSHLQLTYHDNPLDIRSQTQTQDSDGEEEEEAEKEEEEAVPPPAVLITLLKSDKQFMTLLSRLQTAIIPNAYRAFTLLVTSTQYAAMGMVMLGCLARVHEVLKPFMMDEDSEPQNADLKLFEDTIPPVSNALQEDVGEVISRDSIGVQKHRRVRKLDATEEAEGNEKVVVKKRQRVRMITERRSMTPLTGDEEGTTMKKRTAIDDLFADL